MSTRDKKSILKRTFKDGSQVIYKTTALYISFILTIILAIIIREAFFG